MKLAVIGSRTFNDYILLSEKLNEIYEIYGIDEIIFGGAKGADTLSEQYAIENEIPITVIKPIIEQCTMVVAFWDMSSHGTKHALNYAKKIKKYSEIVSV
jgi:hypothetical protein